MKRQSAALEKSRFTYSAFFYRKKRIQKFKETRVSRYIDQNELHKACFQH